MKLKFSWLYALTKAKTVFKGLTSKDCACSSLSSFTVEAATARANSTVVRKVPLHSSSIFFLQARWGHCSHFTVWPLSLSRRRRLNLSNTRLADFLLRWWFTDFLTQIFADFPLNSTTLASYVLLRLSRQIFQLFNKVDSAGKFLPLRRIHTADISLGSDMLLLLLFLSYRRDTFYWLYSSPKP